MRNRHGFKEWMEDRFKWLDWPYLAKYNIGEMKIRKRKIKIILEIRKIFISKESD